jgi:lipoprotein-anchoring transpeptidase ErfK/SrfK
LERHILKSVVNLKAMDRQVARNRQGCRTVKSFSHILAASAAVIALTAVQDARAFPLTYGGDARASIMPPSTGLTGKVRKHTARTAEKTAKAESKTTGTLASRATGPLQVIISLDKQELTLYSGDEAIAHSRVSTGVRGRPTPSGVFSIIQKDRWHRSNLYDDAPMWFMQRITWSGVALHQGIVPNHPASHGCIRMPAAFAQQMWTTTKLGARVIVAHAQLKPTQIAHPSLFQHKDAPPPAPVMTQAQALQAAEQAWTFAQLASKSPLVGATMTDTPELNVPLPPVPPNPNARVLKPGPVSVFVSRKEGKLYVRKGFEPVFTTPVTIDRANEPIGTHVFTAVAQNGDAIRWTVVTMQAPGSAAKEALDRITIPQDAIDQISELTTAGASLVISDQGLGPETGKGTDFIVLTR